MRVECNLNLNNLQASVYEFMSNDARHEYPTILLAHPESIRAFIIEFTYDNCSFTNDLKGLTIQVMGAKLNIYNTLDLRENTFIIK